MPNIHPYYAPLLLCSQKFAAKKGYFLFMNMKIIVAL